MARRAVGVDIGGSFTKMACVSEDGAVEPLESIATESRNDPSEYLLTVRSKIEELARRSAAAGIGIAVPGFMAEDRRSIRFSPNTPSLVGIDFVRLLEPLRIPVYLEQDLNAPTLAEHAFGRHRGAPRLLTASVGTGLGAGLVVDGRIVDLVGGTIGDTGHIILDPNGPACTAGCHGCAEAYVGTAAIERMAEASAECDIPAAAAREVIIAAKEGTPWAVEIIRSIAGRLGQWLASITPIFLPSHVILAGGVSEAGAVFRTETEERFRSLAGPGYANCVVDVSDFRGRAGVVGAAVAVLRNLKGGNG